jgi:hypothetical protein
MLSHLSQIRLLDDRRFRLFSVAACRRVWFWLEANDQNVRALDEHEKLADAPSHLHEIRFPIVFSAWPDDIKVALDWPGWSFALAVVEATKRDVGEKEEAVQASLLRDIFCPFRSPPTIASSWLTWSGACVCTLAKSIYDDRTFERVPILADGLEDAGCTDASLIGHLRGPGPHVKGCWALDAVLGKV